MRRHEQIEQKPAKAARGLQEWNEELCPNLCASSLPNRLTALGEGLGHVIYQLGREMPRINFVGSKRKSISLYL